MHHTNVVQAAIERPPNGGGCRQNTRSATQRPVSDIMSRTGHGASEHDQRQELHRRVVIRGVFNARSYTPREGQWRASSALEDPRIFCGGWRDALGRCQARAKGSMTVGASLWSPDGTMLLCRVPNEGRGHSR